MGCCGERRVNFARAGEGQIAPFEAALFRLPAQKSPAATGRIRKCRRCKFQTWLTEAEYRACRGGELPTQPDGPGRKLFCSRGAFWVPAAAYDIGGQCPENQW